MEKPQQSSLPVFLQIKSIHNDVIGNLLVFLTVFESQGSQGCMIGKVCKENDQFPFTPLVFCVLVLNVVHNW